MKRFWFLIVACACVLALTTCKQEIKEFGSTPYEIKVPQYFPTKMNIPADNPMTVEGIALGRSLFYDGRLSGRTHADSLMTCGTCHIQANSFECGINNPRFKGGLTNGLHGTATPHYMLPLINLVWNESGYLWTGAISNNNLQTAPRNIEDIVWMTLMDPNEIAGDTNTIKQAIQNISGYPEMFLRAFGSSTVTVQNISKAIAQFVRTLTSTDSKFDKYLRGEYQFNTHELNGYVLFMTEDGGDCFHCHGGDGNPLFTTNLFYNNGKDAVPADPFDRYSITKAKQDIGAYKAPTLRNVELTAPYMHDGRFKTLEEVLDFYSSGVVMSEYINPLMHHSIANAARNLTVAEKADLITFIKTLRDNTFLTHPNFGPPSKLPDGSAPRY